MSNEFAYKAVIRYDNKLVSVWASEDLQATYEKGKTTKALPKLLEHNYGLFCYKYAEDAISECSNAYVEIWKVEIGKILTPPELIDNSAFSITDVLSNDFPKGKRPFENAEKIIITDQVTLVERIWPKYQFIKSF